MTDERATIDVAPHRLSNGRYSVTLTHAGAGQSMLGDLALTRYLPDRTRETSGFFIYVRDLDGGAYWSAGYQPVGGAPRRYDVESRDGAVTIAREDADIETRTIHLVSPDDDVELRQITLTNLGSRARRLDVTTYAEVVLNTPAADAGHPAFSKLFVQTENLVEAQALLARRRLRSPDDEPLWLMHLLRTEGDDASADDLGWETDRMRFLGRGRSVIHPRAMDLGAPLTGTTGNVLDPIVSLRRVVRLAPGASATLVAALGGGGSRDVVEELALRYDTPGVAEECVRLVRGNDAASGKAMGGNRTTGARFLAGGGPRARAARSDAGSARSDLPTTEPLRFFNGFGGFAEAGDEYVIRIPVDRAGPRWPPLPWANVIANEQAGFFVSESGAGCMWTANSRENRLTPWSNDPVSDPHCDAVYLRDEDDGTFWSPTPGPAPALSGYEVRHGFGYTTWRHGSHEMEQEMVAFVPRSDPVKIIRLRLRNASSRVRRISIFSYAQLVLGAPPLDTAPPIVTERDIETGAILATNSARGEFAHRVAFAAIAAGNDALVSATGDRRAFLGRYGHECDPAALRSATPLEEQFGANLDACAAFQATLSLQPRQSRECIILLGEAESADAARSLVRRYSDLRTASDALSAVRESWTCRLSAIQVDTPSPELDLMVNGWLAYQNLGCRVWGRSAFYQSGGAFGFRDQLQDTAALVYLAPELTRAQILLHAEQQFVEGDVMHWWHPPLGKGIRTRFSDDLLWLPHITAFYIARTGDDGVLDEVARFLTAPPLEPGEDEVFLVPTHSGEMGSVYEHCCRAIDRSLTAGAHGLPLMGTGDWNDGMNRVGREGRGESVWLGFFLFDILGDFIPICEWRGDAERSKRYAGYRTRLGAALNDGGWDGEWYRRAYYDDGAPLGSAQNDECRIDTIAQAWSVIAHAAPPARAASALDAMERELVSEREGLIRLLAPPFDQTLHDPGYIKGYLPGVRENGGQYTHGALWGVRALAELGRTERGARLLAMLSPVSHGRTPSEVATYQTEPYVIAADVYGVAPHVGRGGWTWYTGSAGWMFRVALESVFGFTLVRGEVIELRPCIPAAWPGFSLRYRLPDGRTSYELVVARANGGAATSATMNGSSLAVERGAVIVPLARDGASHRVEISLGADVGPRYVQADA